MVTVSLAEKNFQRGGKRPLGLWFRICGNFFHFSISAKNLKLVKQVLKSLGIMQEKKTDWGVNTEFCGFKLVRWVHKGTF